MVYEQERNKWYQSGRTSDCCAPFAVPALPSCDDTPFSKTPSSHFSSIPDMVSTNQLDFRDKTPSPASPSLPQVSDKFGASLEIPRVRFDGVLSVIISDCIYQISEDTLHQVFDPYGGVTNIIIRGEYPTLRALVYFDSFATASVAKIFLDGRNLYAGSCLLSIQFYFTDRLPMEVVTIFNPIAKSNLVEPPPKQLQQHWVGQTLHTKRQGNPISHSEFFLDVAIPPTQHLAAANISIEKETKKLLDSKLSLEVEQMDSSVNDPKVIVRSTEARGLTSILQIISKPKKQRKKRQQRKIKRHQLDFDYWHYEYDDDIDDLDSGINDGLDFEPLDNIILLRRSIKLSEYICDGNSNGGVGLFPQVEEYVELCSDAIDEIQQETFFSGYSVADPKVVIDGSNGFSKDYNFGSFNDDNEPAGFDFEGPCAVEDMLDPNKKNEATFIANRHILVFDPGDSYVISLIPPFEDSLMVVFSFGHDYVFPYRNPWGQGLFLGGGNSRAVRVALQRDNGTLVVVDSLIGEKAYVELGTPRRFRELKLSLMFFVEFSGVFIDEDKTIAYLNVAERGVDCKVDGYSKTMQSNSVTELHCFMESNRNAWSRDYLSSMGGILKIDHSFNHGFDPFIDDYIHQAQPAKEDIKIMSKYHFFPENDPMALASFLVEILMKLVCFIEFSGDFAALGAEIIVGYIGATHLKDGKEKMYMLSQLSAARVLATALEILGILICFFGSNSQFWEKKKTLLFLCYCFNVINCRASFGFIIAWRMILGDKDLFKEWGMLRPNTYVWAFSWAY